MELLRTKFFTEIEENLKEIKMNKKWIFIFLIICFLILSCGKKEEKEIMSKVNSPPIITSITILPENPTKESDLTVYVQSRDPDHDNVTYRYQWMKNDAEIVGEEGSVLKGGHFKKGDLIRVMVTPYDGKNEGKSVSSEAVRILNSPPVIQEVWIEPKIPSVRESLKAHIKGYDADGDFIYYTYRWERNGHPIEDVYGEILDKGYFKKGDNITVTVTPDDKESFGNSKKSVPVIISNSPPQIISTPPISIEGVRYLYKVEAIDPDNDPITFTLKRGPKGMKIDKKTGQIIWDIKNEDKGSHFIEIEVTDDEGAKCIQNYTLVVEIR